MPTIFGSLQKAKVRPGPGVIDTKNAKCPKAARLCGGFQAQGQDESNKKTFFDKILK